MNKTQGSFFSHPSQWTRWCVPAALICSFAALPIWSGATAPEVTPPAVRTADPIEELTEIMVEAPEPRYVAPTKRDQIGRIWAPVMINGQGPFRLVLDTGASHSAITALVAMALGFHGSIAAGDSARGHRLCHGAHHSCRHLEHWRSGSRSADVAHRAGRIGRRRGYFGTGRPDGKARFHRFST